MIVIDGQNAAMGRLASYAAKEAIKGNEIAVVNCEKIIITGNRENIEKKIRERKGKIGSGQKGPKYSIDKEKFVKRSIRGMLPNHRSGRGKDMLKKIKCYVGIPKEFEGIEKIKLVKEKANKYIEVRELK